MILREFDDKTGMAKAAADEAARLIREAIAARGRARIVAATGSSQIEFLESLVTAPSIAWGQVELFHLDEYIGLPGDHPASFQHYIRERILARVPVGRAWLLDGAADPEEECKRVGEAIGSAQRPVFYLEIPPFLFGTVIKGMNLAQRLTAPADKIISITIQVG